MDETRNEDTFGKLPTLGRPIPEEKEPEGPARTWTDEDAERETVKRPVSPEEMTLAGRYKVLRRLGEGGMGSVWLAEDIKLDGRKVAIKMLPAVLAGKKGAYRQVKQEALMAMKLSHPNIATVRAFEEEDGNPFLVMDYIEGEGLDDILAEKGKLSEEETLRLLTPVAAALDYAHGQGIVHRDVKPGNVIVRKDGTPFVLDFGIAREIQETLTRVTGKISSGTLLYMSPEQLRGRAPKAAQDVYSFAVVAYECLTGRPPFYRGAVEDQIKNEAPEELPEEIGAPLRCGVMAGLAKEASGRPGSCAEILESGKEKRREKGSMPRPLPNSEEGKAGIPRKPEEEGADRKWGEWRWVAAVLVVVGLIGWRVGSKLQTAPAENASALSLRDRIQSLEKARREEEEDAWRAQMAMADEEEIERKLDEIRELEAKRAMADIVADVAIPKGGGDAGLPTQDLSIPGATVTLSDDGAWLVRYDAPVFVTADHISLEGMKALKATAAALLKLPEGATVTIYGHTDGILPPPGATGPFRTNADLATARAEVAKEHLLVFCKRLPRYTFIAAAPGTAPAPYPNDTDAHRRLNRTITLKISPGNGSPM